MKVFYIIKDLAEWDYTFNEMKKETILTIPLQGCKNVNNEFRIFEYVCTEYWNIPSNSCLFSTYISYIIKRENLWYYHVHVSVRSVTS
jgi:hypothetical protein